MRASYLTARCSLPGVKEARARQSTGLGQGVVSFAYLMARGLGPNKLGTEAVERVSRRAWMYS